MSLQGLTLFQTAIARLADLHCLSGYSADRVSTPQTRSLPRSRCLEDKALVGTGATSLLEVVSCPGQLLHKRCCTVQTAFSAVVMFKQHVCACSQAQDGGFGGGGSGGGRVSICSCPLPSSAHSTHNTAFVTWPTDADLVK